MRILHIADKPVLGGINSVINTTAQAQKLAGHCVGYLSYFSGDCSQIGESAFESINLLNARFRGDPQTIHRVRDVIRQFKPDVIHDHFGNLWSASFLALRMHNYRCFLHFHNELSVIRDSPDKKRLFREWIFRTWLLPRYDGLITINKSSKTVLEDEYPTKPVKMIPNGVFLSQDRFRTPSSSNDKLHLGYIGRIVYEKGVDFLIDLAAGLKNELSDVEINVTIAGDGDPAYISKLKQNIKSKHLSENVTFYGPTKDSHNLLKTFDFLVFPSRMEAFGLTILEAMNAGCPVIVIKPDQGTGPVEIVGEDFPLLLNRNASLTCSIIKSLSKKEILHILNLQNDTLHNYSINSLSLKLLNFYRKI